ncbi:MAG: FecR domain-containing protein [Stenotrophomonas sp.]
MQDAAPRADTPIPAPVLREAAEWLLRFREGELDARERAAWQRWLASNDTHARAWHRAERLAGLLDDVPGAVGSAPLRQARRSLQGRRAALAAIMGMMVGAPLARLAWQREPWQQLVADTSTAIGERRALRLEDGSELLLNTDTRIALGFNEQLRQVQLLRGELLLQEAADDRSPARPLLVQLRNAHLLAVGARFAVRMWDDHVRVAVEQGAVRIRLGDRSDATQVVSAGQQAVFNAVGIGPVTALQRNSLAWVQGVLNAEAMPLGELLSELARYRPGVVRCDPEVARMPVSGVFQLDDTDTVLALLQAGFPLRVRYLSRLWVMVDPA